MSRLDRRADLDVQLNPLIDPASSFLGSPEEYLKNKGRHFSRLFTRNLDVDPLVRATSQVEYAKKVWAEFLLKGAPTFVLHQARLEFLRVAKEYTDVVDNMNKEIDAHNEKI